jgi:hypothetical protein
MQVSWRSSHSLLRSRAVCGVVLFAAAGMALHGQTREGCVIPNAEMVRTLDLDACRPEPVSAAEKATVLQSLPAHGGVTQLSAGERRKMDAIRQLLHTQGRDTVYDLRVIAVPQAWTGLYEKAVLLISLPALTLLDSEELQALAAHEIGHEYVWQQYADAKSRSDTKRLRELELVCDAIALRTLAHEGVSPERLQTAIEKDSWYNRERLGVALNQNNYPSLKERRKLIGQASLLER